MPGERRGSRILIEGQRHLRSEGVSVDAVLERDRRRLDVREQQVLAAVAEDDHCEVSGGGPVLASSYRCLEPTCHQPSTPADFTVTCTFRLSLPRARDLSRVSLHYPSPDWSTEGL